MTGSSAIPPDFSPLAWKPLNPRLDETAVLPLDQVIDDISAAQTRFRSEIDKLQGLRLTRGPLDRLFGMRSLLLDTAGGVGPGAPLILHFLPAAEAEALYVRLSGEVAKRPLRW